MKKSVNGLTAGNSQAVKSRTKYSTKRFTIFTKFSKFDDFYQHGEVRL
jgi:hypothetical protein